MSRLPLAPVDHAPEPFREFMARRGELNVFRLIANAPAVCDGWARMTDQFLDSPTFPPRLRERVILRVAELRGSAYETAQHLGPARQAGATEDPDPTERAALDLVDELCTTHEVRDATFDKAHAALGTEAVTELVLLVNLYYGLALILNAVDLDVDEHARLGAP
ncbi:carboxymuconolactone decarboxylase family protein [Herbidospora mongoliensis]|uniref:carboxymuconolactone decarboxylase family protein n=1 Tax=Herbidospora mongoliensis TaxID=688067 RepID=UPI0008311AEC|nr:carboxymuconolactone decarboxylase family protein [Herbidospora mongoliensis]